MNFHQLVRQTFPAFSDEEVHSFLWEATAFPCAPLAVIAQQITEWPARANSLGQVLYLAYGEADLIWRESAAERAAEQSTA